MSASATILVVDDDPWSRALLRRLLEASGYGVEEAEGGQTALAQARALQPELVLLDVRMPGIDGHEVCRRLKADPSTEDVIVIFLSGLDASEDKVLGLELGAVDYLAKPFHKDEVLMRVGAHLKLRRLERELEARTQALEHELRVAEELVRRADARQEGPLLGSSPALRALLAEIASRGPSSEPVLLTSAGGSGEEAVARALHAASPRARRPFLVVDCLAIPDPTPSDLFGADTRWGLSREGTLYFSRLDALPEALIRSLEERLDDPDAPRVIAFQRAPLAALEPWLRIRVPSLCDRSEDLKVLGEHYLRRKARRLGRSANVLSPASLERMHAHAWPGNLRELQAVIDCALMASSGDAVEVSAALLRTGRRAGSYELVRKVGVGSMGEVWLAKHRLLVRPAAVKVVRPLRLSDPNQRAKALERLEREARSTARLSSLHTIRLHDFGVTDEGSLYYVMELLDGLDLSSLVQGYGPLPAARVVHFGIQACDSLAEAHSAGLVHRDIKPSNLFAARLATEVDVLKVLDFGLVHDLFRTLDSDTRKGVVVGTPAFLPPEGTEGKPDPRGDLYSLGCALFYLLTGRFVFESKVLLEMLRAHRMDPPPRAADLAPHPVPAALDEILWSCLEKDPARRPQSARELRLLLEAVECPTPWGEREASAWWSAYQPERYSAAAEDDEASAPSEATEIAALRPDLQRGEDHIGPCS